MPQGDIIVVAVLYTGAVDVVTRYGDALAGKILVDIPNPFNADVSELATAAGDSVSRQIAAVAPEGTHLVKAFNTNFRDVLAQQEFMQTDLVRACGEGSEVRPVPGGVVGRDSEGDAPELPDTRRRQPAAETVTPARVTLR